METIKINGLKIKNGTKIESKKMIMVVTGLNQAGKALVGYIEYKGRAVGQCSLSLETLENPHFKNEIKIVS